MKEYIRDFLGYNSAFTQGNCNGGGNYKSDIILNDSGILKDVYGVGNVKEYEDNDTVVIGQFAGNKFILGRSPYISRKS